MPYFEIRRNHETLFTVRANDPEHAASVALRRLFGRSKSLSVMRTTGDAGKSGFFQAYRWLPDYNAHSSTGQPFHVF